MRKVVPPVRVHTFTSGQIVLLLVHCLPYLRDTVYQQKRKPAIALYSSIKVAYGHFS